MRVNEFKILVENRIAECTKLMLGTKNIEYTRNDDKLYNFKRVAEIKNETPERALWGMWSKQLISLIDIIEDLDICKMPDIKLLQEKLNDNINYILLLEGLIKEREIGLRKEKNQIIEEGKWKEEITKGEQKEMVGENIKMTDAFKPLKRNR